MLVRVKCQFSVSGSDDLIGEGNDLLVKLVRVEKEDAGLSQANVDVTLSRSLFTVSLVVKAETASDAESHGRRAIQMAIQAAGGEIVGTKNLADRPQDHFSALARSTELVPA